MSQRTISSVRILISWVENIIIDDISFVFDDWIYIYYFKWAIRKYQTAEKYQSRCRRPSGEWILYTWIRCINSTSSVSFFFNFVFDSRAQWYILVTQSMDRGFESHQGCVIFRLIKFRLFQEQLFIIENCPGMVAISQTMYVCKS